MYIRMHACVYTWRLAQMMVHLHYPGLGLAPNLAPTLRHLAPTLVFLGHRESETSSWSSASRFEAWKIGPDPSKSHLKALAGRLEAWTSRRGARLRHSLRQPCATLRQPWFLSSVMGPSSNVHDNA